MAGPVAERIRAKLAVLRPVRLVIEDDSHYHAGHTGARPEGESHLRLEIVSPAFAGESRITRQRRVYSLLADELRSGLHALQLNTLTPEEDLNRT